MLIVPPTSMAPSSSSSGVPTSGETKLLSGWPLIETNRFVQFDQATAPGLRVVDRHPGSAMERSGVRNSSSNCVR